MDIVKQNNALGLCLSEMHRQSDEEIHKKAREQFKGSDEAFSDLVRQYGILAPVEKGPFLKTHGISVQDPALSLAISPEMGQFLFNLTLSKKPDVILEMGSSRGVSTLYFAEALRILGKGKVVATEMDESKCETLWDNVQALGLTSYVDLCRGDVFSMVSAMNESFDMVFIDIWASGYLEAFRKVEKLLRHGAILLADNMYTSFDEVQPFKTFLDTHPGISSLTLDFESGVEFGIVL
ncbi:MAG: putative O-methyltransferase, family 3 [Leptospirillum rubarum]|uniref:Putative O-methyltransferase, family 3 n=1 Tax=Leptospirillum sp. Group II '5-way CG' TaxID=419541 RepID=B6AS80_9BACT|nr:MAG: putative O-methyltransferase, family 3 [Leptospirillum rubarum]EDZ38302.1 MAG: Putative O-methyltransferase, family 3 [Leptospirillum sp. Group II '5-way CG']